MQEGDRQHAAELAMHACMHLHLHPLRLLALLELKEGHEEAAFHLHPR